MTRIAMSNTLHQTPRMSQMSFKLGHRLLTVASIFQHFVLSIKTPFGSFTWHWYVVGFFASDTFDFSLATSDNSWNLVMCCCVGFRKAVCIYLWVPGHSSAFIQETNSNGMALTTRLGFSVFYVRNNLREPRLKVWGLGLRKHHRL